MKNRVIKKWENQKLSVKIMLIIIMVCIISLVGNYIVLQLVYRAYNNQLYVKTMQLFTSYINQIEVEIEKLDTVTLALLGSTGVQENMTVLRDAPKGSVEWLDAKKELGQQVNSYLYNIDAFSSFGICTSDGMLSGSISGLSEEERNMFILLADEKRGASNIVMYNGDLYFLRQIRETKDFLFSNMGTMIGKIDINKIILELGEVYENIGSRPELLLYVDEICVYPRNANVRPIEDDGWKILEDLFVVQCTSKRGWKFLIYTPYGNIQSAISISRVHSMQIIIIVAFVSAVVSYKMLKRITYQIDQLLYKFDAYGKGILPTENDWHMYIDRKDEISVLHNHFYRMAHENKKLNDENYNRMLLQKEAEYKQLQQQIQPHFIFNTLSLITWMAYEHEDNEIAKLVNALSRLVRESMSFSGETICIKKELNLVEDYMMIQKVRFGERLRFEIELPEELENVMVPQMTIQPIVENAVKYALEEMLDPCEIKIVGKIEDDMAIIIVEDNGPGIDTDIIQKMELGEIRANGNGIGLQNIQQRLKMVFTEKYGLEFHRISNYTQVWIRVPWHGEKG